MKYYGFVLLKSLIIMQLISSVALSADKEPIISYQYTLTLPDKMQKVLQDYDPWFRTWNISNYDPMEIQGYEFTDRQALSIVIGDFNGDGVQDVWMDGHDDHEEKLICVLSDSADFKVLEIERTPLITVGFDTTKLWLFYTFISREPFLYAEGDTIKLQGDAIEWLLDSKGCGFYCFQKGKFVEYMTGD